MKTITEDSPFYKVKEGNDSVERCALVINPNTPGDLALTIMRAWNEGYITCEACFTDEEYTKLGFNNEN